ncbi:La-related protein 6 [Hordeum vulgare]|nr:La-related protein 6 [Hordeum vulgare]
MASLMDVGKLIAVRPGLSISEQHLTTEAGEDVDYIAMSKASPQWASVLLYLWKAGYDIQLVDTNGFTRAMSQVKWSIPNPSGSTTIDLFEGPTADLLRHAVKDFRPFRAIEPILSFLKDTLCGGGLGSSITKSHLIDHDHEEGTHKGFSKVKQCMCDMRERTMGWLK